MLLGILIKLGKAQISLFVGKKLGIWLIFTEIWENTQQQKQEKHFFWAIIELYWIEYQSRNYLFSKPIGQLKQICKVSSSLEYPV